MNKEQAKIDREFIRYENKYRIHYKEIKNISYNLLPDFRYELKLNHLSWECCRDDNYELLKKLIESGVDINNTTLNEDSLLMIACRDNNHECAKLSIEHSADVNQRNHFGDTALNIAVKFSDKKMIEILIDNGADVNSKNFLGDTVLQRAKIWSDDKKIVDLLIQNGAHE